jgi:hypothetical protein
MGVNSSHIFVVPMLYLKKQKPQIFVAFNSVAKGGVEPPTSGL